eukprot:437843-Alexandrium_andersonii.AAC.1
MTRLGSWNRHTAILLPTPLQHGHDTARSWRKGLPAATQLAQRSSWNMRLHTSRQHISPGAKG